MMRARDIGRKIIAPSTARPALVRIVERQGNLVNVPELAARVKKVRRTMRIASVAQSERRARDDACASGRRQQAARCRREGGVSRRAPKDRLAIKPRLKRREADWMCALRTRRAAWRIRLGCEAPEPEFGCRHRKQELVGEQGKARFDPQNVGGGKARGPRTSCQHR